ncbi:hypothetical protein BP6252_03931 [Coleophoma cylindrospora]|uniref:Glycosyl transferase family 25 domain-containing protein n=1 Tax=Coleophoma cylindrospora TaxID=1849047 RepID=A0A3D8S8Z3_9HELO|nr:hypothetical protein BP6252_03931 [Coleophoma cylindrospora]
MLITSRPTNLAVTGLGAVFTLCLFLRNRQDVEIGFERVFAISLPERSDKRDGIAVGARVTGFSLEFSDGVRGSAMSQKAMPKNWNPSVGDATLGCWRGHMDVAQKIIRENIQSALIFEDDADWDVKLKEQMYEFAKGAKAVQGTTGVPYSPYGDDWDLLWIGHCGTHARTELDQMYYLIPEDPTMIPLEKVYGDHKPDRSATELSGNQTRMVFQGVGGRCLTGYGLSLRGALKLVMAQSLVGATTIDRGVSGLCSKPKGTFDCIAPWPPFIGTFKDAGPVDKDSDRVSVTGEARKSAWTRDIAYPVRMNIDRLITKAATFRPQWPDQLPELSRGAGIPEGHAVFLPKDSYGKPAS